MLRKNPEQTIWEQLLRQQKTQTKRYENRCSEKTQNKLWEQLLRQPKTQTKRYENRCSEITQKKTKWEQMLRKKKKKNDSRYTGKKPAEMVQTC